MADFVVWSELLRGSPLLLRAGEGEHPEWFDPLGLDLDLAAAVLSLLEADLGGFGAGDRAGDFLCFFSGGGSDVGVTRPFFPLLGVTLLEVRVSVSPVSVSPSLGVTGVKGVLKVELFPKTFANSDSDSGPSCGLASAWRSALSLSTAWALLALSEMVLLNSDVLSFVLP